MEVEEYNNVISSNFCSNENKNFIEYMYFLININYIFTFYYNNIYLLLLI